MDKPGVIMENPGVIVWDEAKRLIARQEASLDTLRTRSLGVLTAGGVVAAVFVALNGRVTHHPLFRLTLSVAAACALLCCAAFYAWIQRPVKFDFAHDLTMWIEAVRERKITDEELTYNLSNHMEGRRQDNSPKIERLHEAFAWMCGAFAVEVVFWVAASLF